MKRAILSVFLFAAWSHAFVQAATTSRTYSSGETSVSINGVNCPDIVDWSGGDVVADVVTESSAKKHLSSVRTTPILMEVVPPLSASVMQCINELCANNGARKTLMLGRSAGPASSAMRYVQASNALLSEVRVPALDAASKTAVRLTLVFEVEAIRPATPPANPAVSSPSRGSNAQSSNFRFSLSGVDGSGVSAVEPFTIQRSTAIGSVGEVRLATSLPGAVVIPDLALTIAASQSSTWTAWRDDFLIKGDCGDDKEKEGALEVLSADMRTVVFSIKLGHVGLKGLSMVDTDEGSVAKLRAALYCESMSIPATGVATSPATSSSSNEPPNAGGSTAGAGAVTPVPAVDRNGRNVAGPGLAPGATDLPARTAVLSPAANIAATTNAGDVGARDPAGFPRPSGSIRTAYTTVRDKIAVLEQASYSADASSDDILVFYEKSLAPDGWEEISRYENNYAAEGAHQVVSSWKKDTRTVTITVVDVAPGKTKIQVSSDLRK